jgi:hypothetical protein
MASSFLAVAHSPLVMHLLAESAMRGALIGAAIGAVVGGIAWVVKKNKQK